MLVRLSITVLLVAVLSGAAFAQEKKKDTLRDRVQAVDFTVQLFFEASGELSPNIFTLEEFGAWNFSAHWKANNGGKFSGFLVRVKLESGVGGRDVFAEGRQAQVIFRDRKTKKILRTWNIADIYVDDRGVSYRGRIFDGLDCEIMEVTLLSGATRITRDLPFACGE